MTGGMDVLLVGAGMFLALTGMATLLWAVSRLVGTVGASGSVSRSEKEADEK